MALALADRIKETTTVTSTGSATLLGASVGYQSFGVLGNGSTTYYCISDQTGANWEVGLGTYSTTGPTLTRTTILSSSNSGLAVNFAAGTKDVFVTIPAAKGVWTDAAGTTGQVLTTSTTGSAPTWVTPTSTQRIVTLVTPTVGQTVFTIAYTVGYIDVFYNGIKLVIADDFVATNGTSVTLNTATILDDVVEFVTFTNLSLVGPSSPTTLTISNKTAAYTVIAGDNGTILNWTSGTFTATLTAAATLGAGFNVWLWNNSVSSTDIITIDPNLTETIDGIATLLLRRGEGTQIVCNGTNWETGAKKTMRGYTDNFTSTDARPTASGSSSLALGRNAIASGVGSFACSFNSTASSDFSIAIGASSSSLANYSVAIGGTAAITGATAAYPGTGAIALGSSYTSGINSFAAAISDNTSSYGARGVNSIAMGFRGTATGDYSVAISSGSSSEKAVASGSSSIILGQGVASGQGSFCLGISVFSANYGKTALCGNTFSNTGQSEGQLGMMTISAITTDATPYQLRAFGQNLSALWLPTLSNNSAVYFKGTIVARQKAANGTAAAAWTIEGLIRQEGTAASATMVTSTVTAVSNVPAWTIAVSADTTYGAINVTFTGAAATNIRVLCNLQMTEINNYA